MSTFIFREEPLHPKMIKPRLLLLVSCALAVSYGQSSGRVSFEDSDSQPRQSQDGKFNRFSEPYFADSDADLSVLPCWPWKIENPPNDMQRIQFVIDSKELELDSKNEKDFLILFYQISGLQFQQFQNQGSENGPSFPQGRPNGTRQGKDLLDWIGLGTGGNVDPYLARANAACLNGDLAECFKSRALNSLSEFFDQQEYNLNHNVRVVRMSRDIVQEVSRQPYEFSSSPRYYKPFFKGLLGQEALHFSKKSFSCCSNVW